jgi:hypothetical protein
MTPEMLSHLVVGAILLFFGRRLFWLFVGAVGFLSGFELAEQLFGVEPGWVAFAVGLLVGGAAAVLAMFFQLVAAGIAGFGVGVYAALELVGPGAPAWLAALCGAVGAVVAVAVFGWALVVLSAMAGAAALLDPFDLASGTRLIGFVALAALGIGVQAIGMERGGTRRP